MKIIDYLRPALMAVLFLFIGCEKKIPEIKVQTGSATDITSVSAVLNGTIVDLAGTTLGQHGFVYATTEEPTVFDNEIKLGTRETTGDFSAPLTGLQTNTTYYFRAYGQTSDKITYDKQRSFTTLMVIAPTVDIDSHDEVTETSVKINATISSDGGAQITARGVCWSSSTQEPTTANDFTTEGSGTGSFSSTITGLVCGTTYYVRAYSTNSAGTSYSTALTVTTTECPQDLSTVSTTSVSSVTETGAQGGGNVTDEGTSAVTAKGICWSTSPNPTTADNKTTDGTGAGAFTSVMTGLTCGTTYYVRAYATNSTGTSYGEQIQFMTTACPVNLPTVNSSSVSSITETGAQGGGNVTSDGGAQVTAKGVCWSTAENPTIADSKTNDGTGTGSYISTLTGLSCGTTYYARAYATNSAGTSYGAQVSFTTTACTIDPPTVTTSAVSSITETSAQGGGSVTDEGGAAVTAKGICWSTSQNPTITDNTSVDGTGSGGYTSAMTGLTCGTTYYVRAYATNSAGTSYGSEVTFTTTDCSADVPDLNSAAISNITQNSAQGGGTIFHDNGAPVTARGICWSTSQNPTTSDNTTDDGTGTGTFTSQITGLSCGTTYYVRAYATNSAGTAYGEQKSFTTTACGEVVVDYDGNVYQTVTIGSQVWMAENLNVTHYPDGTLIPYVSSDGAWANLDHTDEGMCWYNNDDALRATYGSLYTWETATYGTTGGSESNPSGIQGVCPDGWHLPSDAEWKQLEMYLGMSQSEADKTGHRGTDEGGKLKEAGYTHWASPNEGATNSSGFNGLPGGFRQANDFFKTIYEDASFWTTTVVTANTVYYRDLLYQYATVWRDNGRMHNGMSIRCVKD